MVSAKKEACLSRLEAVRALSKNQQHSALTGSNNRIRQNACGTKQQHKQQQRSRAEHHDHS